MIAEIPEDQARAAVELIAAETLAEAGVVAPPVDALELAARLGLVVARDSAAGVRARFVRLAGDDEGGQSAILLADDPRPERRHWAVAHEIGESRAHRVFGELGLDPTDAPPAARESVANRLAGCLLLPRQWLLSAATATDWDLVELKRRFHTASHELVARRMLEMPPPVIVTLADQGRTVWRKSNRHSRTPPLTAPERAAWQAAHELGEPARCDASELPEGVEDVRAWPIHEPDWKREIVRTALADEW
jgi:Zn-dependent peptidase ImmA (M78 family)